MSGGTWAHLTDAEMQSNWEYNTRRTVMPTHKEKTQAKPKNLFPLGDKVVVIPAPRKEVTDGGVLLPEDAQKLPRHGKVFAVGPDVTKVQKGQNVLFASYAGHELELDDGVNPPLVVLIMAESNIDAVVE